MSAFVMSETGFDQLASELFARVICDHNPTQWAIQHHLSVEPSESTFDAMEGKVRAFVQHCYAMNVNAVNQRYEESDPPAILKFTDAGALPKWSDEQLFKHLECLSYQCAEGNVPESQLYKQLEELIGAIARAIVGKSKTYDAAKWDFAA